MFWNEYNQIQTYSSYLEDTEKYFKETVERLTNFAIASLKSQNTLNLAENSVKYIIDSKFSDLICDKGKQQSFIAINTLLCF